MSHNPSIALLLETLRTTPDPVKSESGHRCPKCGALFLVARGRHARRSKPNGPRTGGIKWLAWHSINPRCEDTGRFVTNEAASELQAIEMCRIAAEDL